MLGPDRRLFSGCYYIRAGHREPSAQVHSAEIGSIRLGSLFLTLPTRALTGQQTISSEG
jgi:hypothetical protein